MYTQDEFESADKNICKTDTYELHTTISNNHMQIRLKTTPKHKDYYRYSANITLLDLEESLQDKFETLKNLQVYLLDSHNISVDLLTGIIGLVISVELSNGKAITTRIGQIKLKEDIFDSNKCLDQILYSCQHSNIFNEVSFKNIMSEFANMLKVLFKKFQVIQESDKTEKRSHFYSFRSQLMKPQKQPIYPSEKTIRIQRQFHERAKSINLMHGTVQKSKLGKQNTDVEQLKKELNAKIEKLDEYQQKQDKQMCQMSQKIDKLKKETVLQMQEVRKACVELQKIKQLEQPESILYLKSIPSEQSRQGTRLLSPASQHRSIPSQMDIQVLKKQFEDFSEAVIGKIQNLGKSNQLIEDKLKRVVAELDIRLEQRLVKESIHEIQNQIIDKEALFFDQFQLKGMQIQYRGEDSMSTMLLSKTKLSQKNSYSIKIIKTLVNNIQIGIVDSDYRNKRDCWTLPNFILYVGWNSTIYEGPNDLVHKEGNSIAEGDVVTMRANIETGLIEWLVDGQVRAKVVWQKLKDKSINWVPMIRFYDNGDVISWVTDKMLRV